MFEDPEREREGGRERRERVIEKQRESVCACKAGRKREIPCSTAVKGYPVSYMQASV